MSIEIIHFKESTAEQTIKNLHEKKLLIPFFGAGFTKGSRSKLGTVPDAKKMISSIKSIALTNNETAQEHEEINNIEELKTAYQILLDDKYIPELKRRNFLENSFSNVQIDSEKKNLLRKNWKRIYTFNIDDGIEKSKLGLQVVCPFRNVSVEFVEGNKCLMKIHGDITEYMKYYDSSVVFSWLEYAKSVEDNKAMANILESDAKNRALLFIGCSLDKEIDLMLIAAKHKFHESIFIMKGKPNISDKKNLETYGIKKVIWFDGYEDIYQWLNKIIDNEAESKVDEHVNIHSIQKTRESIIKYVSNGGPVVGGKNEISLIETNAKREILDEIRRSLRNNRVIIIEGRRFSGKTTLAADIYQSFNEYRSYIHHNNVIGNADNIEIEIKGEGKLFIIDTDSIHHSRLEFIFRNLSPENKIIIFSKSINTNSLKNILEKTKTVYETFSLPDKLNSNEIKNVNQALDEIGVMHYSERKTLLDNAWSFCREYENEIGKTKLFSTEIDHTLFKVLLLLQNKDYVDENTIRSACNEKYLSIDSIVESSGVVFEKTVKNNTNYISCNAKTWSISALEEKSTSLEIKAELISECIQSLVENGYTETADDLIRFSRLNEIFGGMSHGASSLIRLVHLKIRETFSKSSHYWLQKSKCELIAGKTEIDINNGILDAKKVINDNKEKKNRTYYSAILVLAQLRSKEFVTTQNKQFLLEMLDLYLESLKNRENNIGYIEKVKQKFKDKKGDIYKSISALKDGQAGIAGLARKEDIDYLISDFNN
jgi:hypothetical protein